ncbi:MAG: tRNA epoxyqueuosine(34) reductase QueG [Anaerolineaceae bacterium]|nr:tRNA epoxyqueuosine(34) reductase QueG [Anaerolineaceae bacterium]
MIPDKNMIKAEAEKLGFCLCGFTSAEPLEDFVRYEQWLGADPTGTMAYLKREDTLAKRSDPRRLLPDAKSICVLAVPMGLFPSPEDYSVASYARYDDYHEAILPMASALAELIRQQTGEPFAWKICIDAAPVLERSLAVRAGLGWIGKSSMLINRRYGSALFLCEILMSIEIEPDEPYTGEGCGKCTRCVDACPNHCIDPETRTIWADHCISYLTIEHKGEFTGEQIREVGTHLFGCDDCLLVCPWNSRNSGSSPIRMAEAVPNLSDDLLTEAEFKEKFRTSPVLRTKYKGLRRNIEAVRKNSASLNDE